MLNLLTKFLFKKTLNQVFNWWQKYWGWKLFLTAELDLLGGWVDWQVGESKPDLRESLAFEESNLKNCVLTSLLKFCQQSKKFKKNLKY